MKEISQRLRALENAPPSELDEIGTVECSVDEVVPALLALAFPDRIGQLQRNKLNAFSLANGRELPRPAIRCLACQSDRRRTF
eukprot:4143896-Pleurochrysis_carterae.AAC.1